MCFKAGAEVKAGETLLTTIEPGIPTLLDPRAKAQALARVSSTQASVEQAAQTLEVARTNARFAKANWDRVQQLGKSGGISVTDRDNAERDALLRQQEVRSSEFAQKVAQYELEQAQAALLQMTQLPGQGGASVEVKSPITGQILKVSQESATFVAPGTAIVEVGDPADIEIEAEILSRDAVAIHPGADVSVEQWGGEAPLQARVRLVEPAAFTKVSALGVEEQRVYVLSNLVQPPPSGKFLGDRYRVEVRIATWHSDEVLLAPSGALFREGSEWKTYRFREGKAEKVSVEIGHSDGHSSEVLHGLSVGDQVLLHPPDTVKDGVRISARTVE